MLYQCQLTMFNNRMLPVCLMCMSTVPSVVNTLCIMVPVLRIYSNREALTSQLMLERPYVHVSEGYLHTYKLHLFAYANDIVALHMQMTLLFCTLVDCSNNN